MNFSSSFFIYPSFNWLLFRNSIPQADQRKGRTGRTCDGHVYRLVTGAFFNQLEEYEPPAIERLSLRKQILLLLCAESKAINDPKGTCYFSFVSSVQ